MTEAMETRSENAEATYCELNGCKVTSMREEITLYQ
jgi:hypothetical protein